MTIRTRLAAMTSLLLAVLTVALGYGVQLVYRQYSKSDVAQRISITENSVERAASDALLQKDDVLLISYINFLRVQYPSLAYARIRWESEGKTRNLVVGQQARPGRVRESGLQVAHPGDPSRRVSIQLGIDLDALEARVGGERQRLTKTMALASALTILLGILLSYWVARSLTAPVEALARVAHEVGGGRLGRKLEWRSEDELGELVKAFNAMSQRLEELDETKKGFVSSVTHELRSPLGAIESFLHLVEAKLRGKADAESAQSLEYLSRIQQNVQRLTGFITDLLDVAKIEKGKMECVLKPMRFQDVAHEVCQFFEAKARQQGVRIESRLNGLPEVLGDAERLRQVLVNLVSNGLKFTSQGGSIVISGEQYREGATRWVEVTVRDTGRGMDPRDLQRLFKAFSQGRNVAEGVIGTKGTGLGLYIVKSIIEQHGGRIDARSVPGQGTDILFSLKTV